MSVKLLQFKKRNLKILTKVFKRTKTTSSLRKFTRKKRMITTIRKKRKSILWVNKARQQIRWTNKKSCLTLLRKNLPKTKMACQISLGRWLKASKIKLVSWWACSIQRLEKTLLIWYYVRMKEESNSISNNRVLENQWLSMLTDDRNKFTSHLIQTRMAQSNFYRIEMPGLLQWKKRPQSLELRLESMLIPSF